MNREVLKIHIRAKCWDCSAEINVFYVFAPQESKDEIKKIIELWVKLHKDATGHMIDVRRISK